MTDPHDRESLVFLSCTPTRLVDLIRLHVHCQEVRSLAGVFAPDHDHSYATCTCHQRFSATCPNELRGEPVSSLLKIEASTSRAISALRGPCLPRFCEIFHSNMNALAASTQPYSRLAAKQGGHCCAPECLVMVWRANGKNHQHLEVARMLVVLCVTTWSVFCFSSKHS